MWFSTSADDFTNFISILRTGSNDFFKYYFSLLWRRTNMHVTKMQFFQTLISGKIIEIEECLKNYGNYLKL